MISGDAFQKPHWTLDSGQTDTDTFWRRNAPVPQTICENNVTPHSSSRTRTAHLAWGSKNYLPVRPPNLLKKMHPSAIPNQNSIRKIQYAQRRKKRSIFVKLHALSRNCQWDKNNGKGEKFCIDLCQPKLWQLRPSHHAPTLFRANIRTHATTWCATSESWASWKLTYQKKLSIFFFAKLTLCADLLLGHIGRGTRGWSHGSPKPHWLKVPQNCSMDKLLTNTTNGEVHCKREHGLSVIPVCSKSNITLFRLQSPWHPLWYIRTTWGTISQSSFHISSSLCWSSFD